MQPTETNDLFGIRAKCFRKKFTSGSLLVCEVDEFLLEYIISLIHIASYNDQAFHA